MAYVYRHIRLDKNEPFYIGIGSDNLGKYKRAYFIGNRKTKNPHWFNIINKTKYEVEIILDNLTWEEACQKEIEFIKLYGRKDLGTGILCNKTDGGDGTLNLKVSEETKLKQRLAKLNKPGSKKGFKCSKEQIEKMKEVSIKNSKFGKDNVNSKPILQYDLNGNFIREFSCGREVTRVTNICFKGVSRALTNKLKHYRKFLWFYKKTFNNEILNQKLTLLKKSTNA